MKKFIEHILGFFTKKIIAKYTPDIIAITGSVGKTSTKEAVYAVLKDDFHVRASQKNFNNEIGVPLTVIGVTDLPGRSFMAWLQVLAKGVGLLLMKKEYPKILILEMGLDRPGDIDYLTNLVRPNIGIVTAIGSPYPVHAEFFDSADDLVNEKMNVVKKINKNGLALLNRDDQWIWKKRQQVKANLVSFGMTEEADFCAGQIRVGKDLDPKTQFPGMSFQVSHEGANIPMFLPRALGTHQISAVLPAIAIGRHYGMNLVKIAEKVRAIAPLPGRMNLLPGIKRTWIIDDTYNSSPAAARAALEVLAGMSDKRRWAVLGDMAELGAGTIPAHTALGEYLAKSGIEYLITVGEKARTISNTAIKKGLSEEVVFEFSDAAEAGKFLQERIKQNDLVLVKGSQSMRMERVVEEIMADPQNAAQLLVRQDASWKKE